MITDWRKRLLVFWLIPAVALHLIHIVTVQSPVPVWRRLLFIEDACPYFMCLILPAVIFGLVSIIARPAKPRE